MLVVRGFRCCTALKQQLLRSDRCQAGRPMWRSFVNRNRQQPLPKILPYAHFNSNRQNSARGKPHSRKATAAAAGSFASSSSDSSGEREGQPDSRWLTAIKTALRKVVAGAAVLLVLAVALAASLPALLSSSRWRRHVLSSTNRFLPAQVSVGQVCL